MCWYIWNSRCKYYFDGTSSFESSLHYPFKKTLHDLGLAKNFSTSFLCDTPNPLVRYKSVGPLSLRWLYHSPFHHIIFNTDGASKGNLGPFAAGSVHRRSNGTFISAFSIYLGTFGTNYLAEVSIILHGIKQAAALVSHTLWCNLILLC